jgi:hypothetical protein
MPPCSPQEAARAALAEYDANKDGYLDASELKRCPALLHGLKQIDKNGDNKLSANEIADRLASFQENNVGLVGIACRIKFDGKALEGATVTLEPEKFMGSGFERASGESDAGGHVILRIEGLSAPGVRWGYYRIEVSKKDAGGAELVPARYNSSTTLGQEVRPDRREAIILNLTKS